MLMSDAVNVTEEYLRELISCLNSTSSEINKIIRQEPPPACQLAPILQKAFDKIKRSQFIVLLLITMVDSSLLTENRKRDITERKQNEKNRTNRTNRQPDLGKTQPSPDANGTRKGRGGTRKT